MTPKYHIDQILIVSNQTAGTFQAKVISASICNDEWVYVACVHDIYRGETLELFRDDNVKGVIK